MKKWILIPVFADLFLICGCGASVVFVSDRDGRDQIYSMAGNGFNQRNLSNSSAYEHFPDISPDGTKIIFSSLRNLPGENIYIMDLDGQNVQQVTTGTGQRTRPRWAPNGLIAFHLPRSHPGRPDMDAPERRQRACRGDKPGPERVRRQRPRFLRRGQDDRFFAL